MPARADGHTQPSGSRRPVSLPGGGKGWAWLPGALHAPTKTTLNEKDYRDHSGHRPATRRMWLSDTGHLSAATGLSCRGRLLAVCPALAGCLLGSRQLAARGLHETGGLGSRPQLPPNPAQRTKAAQGGESKSGGYRPGGVLQDPRSLFAPPSSGAERAKGRKAQGPGFSLRLPSCVTLGT